MARLSTTSHFFAGTAMLAGTSRHRNRNAPLYASATLNRDQGCSRADLITSRSVADHNPRGRSLGRSLAATEAYG